MHLVIRYLKHYPGGAVEERHHRVSAASEVALDRRVREFLAARGGSVTDVRVGEPVRYRVRARRPYDETTAYAKREARLAVADDEVYCLDCHEWVEPEGELDATGISGVCSRCRRVLE